jgi:hypothetical protein
MVVVDTKAFIIEQRVEEKLMVKINRAGVVAATLLGATLLFSAKADAVDLTGAWASAPDLCGQVFTKKGNETVFAELSDLYGAGFIVDGNRIRGKTVRCTIQSRKQDGDHLQLKAACATKIMTQDVAFDLTFLDENNLTRAVPNIPGMNLRYSRCKP